MREARAIAAPQWHALSAEEALRAQGSGSAGLAAAEVARRLAQFGPNRLTPPRRRGAVLRFLRQFHNLLIYVLLGSAVVTSVLGHAVDTAVILGVVVINALIGFVQEGKAERALDAIRELLAPRARVMREGRRETIEAALLVPGDIVLLGPGDRVPADLRLVQSRDLCIDEAALTGESQAAEKSVDAVAADALLGDRLSMAYGGTLVLAGQGIGVTVATGDAAEIGRIGRLLASLETVATPLLKQMARFGRALSAGILLFAVLTLGFGVLVHGQPLPEMFLAAVSFAVAAIPEGLPAIMTIALAIGVQRMARRQAIIRRLPAVETLGAVTIICADKTGTLTRNEMTVERVIIAEAAIDVSGLGYEPRGGFSHNGHALDPSLLTELAQAALLCNDASLSERSGVWRVEGDPTEGALLALALKAGLAADALAAAWPRIDALPFVAERRFMATLHGHADGALRLFVKGAPERVLAMCRRERFAGGHRPLDAEAWKSRVEALAKAGYRVLALAVGTPPEAALTSGVDALAGELTLLGLVGLADPPREDAVHAVAACRSAGIRVKMITGDHAHTAAAVARRMGFASADRGVLTGAAIEALSNAALRDAVREVDVFARMSPEHKLRLVEAMQANGEVVAMTGDGVNDAPALTRADVGIAMGRKGTEAAKEAAQMVIADDNFASIAAAVMEGRVVYDNLRKAVLYVLPTSMGQAAMVLIAVLFGLTPPITPLQILWINLVTNVTLSLALAFERPEPGLMARPPRPPREPLIDGFMAWRVLLVTTLLALSAFGIFLWQQQRGEALEVARSAAVNMFVLGQIAYLFNCRKLKATGLSREGLAGNRQALLAAGVLLLLQLGLTYLPIGREFFGMAPLGAGVWAVMLMAGLALFLAVEAEKFLRRRQVRAAH